MTLNCKLCKLGSNTLASFLRSPPTKAAEQFKSSALVTAETRCAARPHVLSVTPPDSPVTFQSHSSAVSHINRYFVILCSQRTFRNCYLEVISLNLLMTFPNTIHRKRNEQIPSWLEMKPESVQPQGRAGQEPVTCSSPPLQIRAKKSLA